MIDNDEGKNKKQRIYRDAGYYLGRDGHYHAESINY